LFQIDDRTTRKRREHITIDKAELAHWKNQKRTGDALPKRVQDVIETGQTLVKEAKRLGRAKWASRSRLDASNPNGKPNWKSMVIADDKVRTMADVERKRQERSAKARAAAAAQRQVKLGSNRQLGNTRNIGRAKSPPRQAGWSVDRRGVLIPYRGQPHGRPALGQWRPLKSQLARRSVPVGGAGTGLPEHRGGPRGAVLLPGA